MTTRRHEIDHASIGITFKRGPYRHALVCAALALGACDDGQEFAGAADLVGPDELDEPALAAAETLHLGDEGQRVRAAHAYLRRFGYFPNPELAAQYPGWTPMIAEEPDDLEMFGQPLADALTRYQENYGLSMTGALDAATQAMMQRPRCSFPDSYGLRPTADLDDEFGPGGADDASGDGSRWVVDSLADPVEPSAYKIAYANLAISDLRYGLLQPTSDIGQSFQVQALQAAASTWSAAAPAAVVFTQRSNPDVTVSFVPKAHGDGQNFNDLTTAHTNLATGDPNKGLFGSGADIHLNDQAFTWGDGYGAPVLDVQTNILHNLGHALGLDHSSDPNAVMFGAFPLNVVRRGLAADDINGIRAIYPTFRDLRIFEPDWYFLLNPVVADAVGWDKTKGSDHWLKFGRIQGFTGSPVFDISYYVKTNPGVPKDFIAAFWHWRESGLAAGLGSSPVFDAKYYLNYWPDLKGALGATNYSLALVHYLVNGIKEGRRASMIFDPVYYLQQYPDVAQTYGATNYKGAVIHWLTYGYKAGRKGAP